MSKFNGNGRKGQGAFEYILLLAGVLLVVVLAIVILKGSVLGGATNSIGNQTAQYGTQTCGTAYLDPLKGSPLSGSNITVCCNYGITNGTVNPAGSYTNGGMCCLRGINLDPNAGGAAAPYGLDPTYAANGKAGGKCALI